MHTFICVSPTIILLAILWKILHDPYLIDFNSLPLTISYRGRASTRLLYAKGKADADDNSIGHLVDQHHAIWRSLHSVLALGPTTKCYFIGSAEFLTLFRTLDLNKQLDVERGKSHSALRWPWDHETVHSHPWGPEDGCAKVSIFPMSHNIFFHTFDPRCNSLSRSI